MHFMYNVHVQVPAELQLFPLSSCLYIQQVARSEMDKCQQKLAQANSEEERAEANIGIEFYDALVKALDGGQ